MKNSSSNLVISGERDIEIFRSATGILEIIRNEAFNKKGEGFTLEIQPKITKSRVYTQALFKKTWKYSATDSFISNWELEWKQGLSYQLNEVKTVLPPAIQIKLMLQEILVDERKNNPENWSDTAHYVEGQRVLLNVPSEYSSFLYKSLYADAGFSFCDYLLENYSKLLSDMATYVATGFHNILNVNPEDYQIFSFHVGRHLICKWFYDFGSSGCDPCGFKRFSDYGMQNLSSLAQQYGMALAILKTIHKIYPQTAHIKPSIFHGYDSLLTVEYQKDVPTPTLRNW